MALLRMVAACLAPLLLASAAVGEAVCQRHGCDHALLQRASLKSKLSLSPALGSASVEGAPSQAVPFNCTSNTGPVQVLRDGDGYSVRALDIYSGEYSTVYRVPFSRTSPAYQQINGCGVGPVDDVAYCVLKMPDSEPDDRRHFLVRIDAQRVEFVGRMPGWSFKAMFGADGTFYSVVGRKLYRVPSVHSLPGFDSQSDAGLEDLQDVPSIDVGNVGNDIVEINADLEGSGSHDYIVSCRSRKVFISRADVPNVRWELAPADQALPDGGFGAAWKYQNQIFFASNEGRGIYEVRMSTANLTLGTVQTEYVGPSVRTNRNDGMNCMKMKAPELWSEPGRCVLWGEPHIQVFDHADSQEGAIVDMFSVGDYWLVKSADVSIQGRYMQTQWSNSQAATSAIAIGGPFLQDHKLIIESMAGNVTWDGEEILAALPSEFAVDGLVRAQFQEEDPADSLDPSQAQLHVKSVHLELPLGVAVTVNRWAQHIDVVIMMHPQLGGQDGHCGNFNGNASDDTAEQIQERMGAPVPPEQLLFPDSPRVAEARHAAVTLDDCPRDLRSRAEELCMRAEGGSRPGVFHETCVFDVCFGGEEFASADAAMDLQAGRHKPSGTPIRWASHPEMCLDVGGGQPLNGSVLQIWTCEDGHPDMQFLLPEGGRGQIRWAQFPKMCLDVASGDLQDGTRLQFWECEEGHPHMEFVVSAGQGEIRWATEPDKCLDVRDGQAISGTHMQLWTCMGGRQANQEFSVGM